MYNIAYKLIIGWSLDFNNIVIFIWQITMECLKVIQWTVHLGEIHDVEGSARPKVIQYICFNLL